MIFTNHNCWLFVSGWQDSNLRPPAPKAGALTGLRYTPWQFIKVFLAERGGFEPPVRFPARMFSKHVVSATHPPLRVCWIVQFFQTFPLSVERECKYRISIISSPIGWKYFFGIFCIRPNQLIYHHFLRQE